GDRSHALRSRARASRVLTARGQCCGAPRPESQARAAFKVSAEGLFMVTRLSRFDADWWVVQKRFIYLAIIIASLALVAGCVGLYVYFYGNPFKGVAADIGSAAGARFVSLEGGVKVVRANTRESLQARADTRLFPGDIVQTQEDGRARITLADGSNLFVKPNSVVTIAENTAAENGKSTKVRVAVESGQI